VDFIDTGPRAAVAAAAGDGAAAAGVPVAVAGGVVSAQRPLLALNGMPEGEDEAMAGLLAGGSGESDEDGGGGNGGPGQEAPPAVQHGDDQLVAELMRAALEAGSKKYVQDVRDGFLRETGRECGFSNERIHTGRVSKDSAVLPLSLPAPTHVPSACSSAAVCTLCTHGFRSMYNYDFSQYIECILVLRSTRMHVRHCCLAIDLTKVHTEISCDSKVRISHYLNVAFIDTVRPQWAARQPHREQPQQSVSPTEAMRQPRPEWLLLIGHSDED
jgi:hypothetical protein